MTVTTRQNYDKVMWTEIDQIATMNFATEKAMAEGEARGEAIGKEAVARAMLADKMEISLIAKYTGLAEDQIKAL